MPINSTLERRSGVRIAADCNVALMWKGETGLLVAKDASAQDFSANGMALRCEEPIPVASCLILRAAPAKLAALGQVRHCTWNRAGYRIGVRLLLSTNLHPSEDGLEGTLDDFLRQAAQPNTVRTEKIDEWYRNLSFRYHPDNADPGDSEVFLAVREIYRIAFADGDRFVERRHKEEATEGARDVTSVRSGSQPEIDRRLRLLSLLYQRRMTDCNDAGMSAQEIASYTGAGQRELTFGLWYLREKGLISAGDSSLYAISVNGVDAFEAIASEKSRMNAGSQAFAEL
jgi:hypothetical protein